MAFMLTMNWSQELLRMRVGDLLGARVDVLGTYAQELEELQRVHALLFLLMLVYTGLNRFNDVVYSVNFSLAYDVIRWPIASTQRPVITGWYTVA